MAVPNANAREYEVDIELRVRIDENAKTFSVDDEMYGGTYTSGYTRLYVAHSSDVEYVEERTDEADLDLQNAFEITDGCTLLFKVADDTYVFTGGSEVRKFRLDEPVLGFSCIYPYCFSKSIEEVFDAKANDYRLPFSFALTEHKVLMFGYKNGKELWCASRDAVEQKLADFTQNVPVYSVDLDGLPRWDHLEDMFDADDNRDNTWTQIPVTTLVKRADLPHPHLNMSIDDCLTHAGWKKNPPGTRRIIAEPINGTDLVVATVVNKRQYDEISTSSEENGKRRKRETLYAYIKKRDEPAARTRLAGRYVVGEYQLTFSSQFSYWPDHIMLHVVRRYLLGSAARAWVNRRDVRRRAASLIQSAWRDAITDPAYKVCRKRLIREFDEIRE
jgi:hypothetical protein